MVQSTSSRSRDRGEFRAFSERAAIRPYAGSLSIDERPLARAVKPLLAEGDRVMRQLRTRGLPQSEALLQCSKGFSDAMCELCMAAVLARDQRAVQLVRDRGVEALSALRTLGALDPPWMTWQRDEGRAAREGAARDLASALDATRANREYALRSRIVRTQTADNYSASRFRPKDLASSSVSHVLTAADVGRLRNGETLVLDPTPALLTRDGFVAAMADLLAIVRRRAGVTESTNPCNLGSYHGMLPVNPSMGGEAGLGPHTCKLLRALAALPAIVERHGWHRPLALPAMVQLGFYPGGTGACYRPHLDRWANEVDNRRELTFLLYVNVDWDASKLGGCLRLHPDVNRPGEGTLDVEPIAGRIVVFESGKQMHEVMASAHGADRIALTLWVEYEDAWQQPDRSMMPALQP